MKVMHEHVAGIDVHKKMIKVAVRSPGARPWTRKTEVLTFKTFYGVLKAMARELRRRGVTHVAMEASGVFTEPVYYALMEEDFEQVLVVNPAHVKAVKGQKTDAKDCARIAELLECGLLQGSYMPPPELKEVRDLTRYRIKKVQARTSEIQRLGKTLESAGIKLGSVVSDITGKGPAAMIGKLIDGERRGAVMADLAIGATRTAAKMADLSMALEGRFTDHHALMCRLHPGRDQGQDAAVAGLDMRIAARAAPWQREAGLLKSVPGFGDTSPGPGSPRSARPRTSGSPPAPSWPPGPPWPPATTYRRQAQHSRTGDAGTYIKPMLVQAAWAAVRVKGRLQARYHKLVRRMGGAKNPAARKKAIVAIAHTLLKIAYAVLKTGRPCQDPGEDFYDRRESAPSPPGLAGAAAPEAPPRLHHHRHHHPATRRPAARRPAGRLNPPAVCPPLTPGAAQPAPAGMRPATTLPANNPPAHP